MSPELVAEQWLAGGYAAATCAEYRRRIRTWLDFCRATHLDPWDVRIVHLQAFLDTLNANTRRATFSALRGFYSFSAKNDYICRDLSTGLRTPPKPRARPGTWATPDELRRMLAITTDDPPDQRALAALLILTGMRLTEALSINICHITPATADLPTLITLTRKASHRDQIGVPSELTDALTPLLARRTTGPLLRHHGGRMSAWIARTHIANLGQRAGCAMRITPHSLRRSFVTLARDLGVSDLDIMATTGHTTAQMIDRYDRGRREHLGTASMQVSNLLKE